MLCYWSALTTSSAQLGWDYLRTSIVFTRAMPFGRVALTAFPILASEAGSDKCQHAKWQQRDTCADSWVHNLPQSDWRHEAPPSCRLPTRCIIAIANLSRTWGEFFQRVNLTLHLPSTTRGCCKAIVPVNGEQRAVKVMRKVIRVKTKVDGPQMKTGRFRIPGERQVSII